MLNTRQLHYVITVANERSISLAAKKLMISQPSLSQYIQKLEKELGVELFERVNPLRLTYAEHGRRDESDFERHQRGKGRKDYSWNRIL